jgi:hypothetical protein
MVLRRVTIGSLPDDVLLEIFYVYKKLAQIDPYFYGLWHECWPKLVQVCRRWRLLIFASSHRLNLQLFCTPKRSVRKMLDIWPAFPLVVNSYRTNPSEDLFDNFVAALERRDRVHEITVSELPGFAWEKITTLVEETFPALTTLDIDGWEVPVGDTFLNGSAPNLQHLSLRGISIPRRLGSATHLRSLHLTKIPNSGYIPPETMATSLSALPQLESLTVDFESPTPQPKRRNRPVPPLTRFALPTLTKLEFKGVSEYLEVLTARIDAPLLEDFWIVLFHQLVFDIPQIVRFLGYQDFKLLRPSSLTLRFELGLHSTIVFHISEPMRSEYCMWMIKGKSLDWQVFSITQICRQILSLHSSVESLNITYDRWYSELSRADEIDPTLWLQLFQSFTSVQTLQISEPLITAVLPPLTGQPAADVLPLLHTLSILGDTDISDETAQQVIQSFVAARQLSGRPVTASRWKFA